MSSALSAESRTRADTALLSSPSRPSPASANADTYSGSATARPSFPPASVAALIRAASRRSAKFRSA